MVPKLKEKIIIKWQTVFTFANTYIFFCNCTFCHNRRTHFRSRQITCDIAEIISCSLSHIFSVRYAAAIIQLLQFHSCESLFSFGWLPLFWACFIQEFVTSATYLSFCTLEWNEFLQLHCSLGPPFNFWIGWAIQTPS